MNIREGVIEILSKYSEHDNIKEYFENNDELSEIGVDSISFIKIIIELEQKFDVEFDDVALEFSSLNSFKKLCEYIEELCK